MIYIDVPDYNDSYSSIELDGKEYLLRFTWNGSKGYWSFGVYETDRTPILAMVKIVPNWNVIHYYPAQGLPAGMFGAISDKDVIGRDDFKDRKALFVFIPVSDLEA